MTQEHDPHHHPHGVGEAAHELVHEIREEIGHVVEHVPKPVRWTVRKLVLLTGLALAGLVILAVISVLLYYANRTELVAHELTLVVNNALRQRSDVSLQIGDLRGNPFQRVRLIEPRVRFVDGEGPVFLEAPWIELRYSPWNLIGRGRRAIDVVIESPTLRLGRDAQGKVRLPRWVAATRRPGAGGFDVRLVIKNGDVLAPRPYDPVRDLDLDVTVALGGGTRVVAHSVRWRSGPYQTRDLALAGELTAADSVRVVLRRLTTPDLDVSGEGRWKTGSDVRTLAASVRRLRWRWVALATHNRTFDVPGEARASVTGTAVGSAVTGRFTTHLAWNDLPADAHGEFVWKDGRLQAERLALESPAGTLAGRLAWSRQGWEVGGDVRRGDPAKWGAIGIPGWPEGFLNGTFRYAVDTRRLPASARLTAALDASELAGWRVDQGAVHVSFPASGPDSFAVHVERRGGTFDLLAGTTPGGWRGPYQARDYPLDEWPDGRASGLAGTLARGEGTAESSQGTLAITGALEGRASRWLGMTAASWRLDDVQGALLPKPDLTGRARLADVTFLGVHFDSAAAGIALGDEQARLDDVSAVAGDTTVAFAGRSEWRRGGWTLEIDRAEARSSAFHWTAEPPVRLAGDPAGVVFERLVARDSIARLAIEGRWASPGGRYDWTARAEGLDLSRLGLPAEWRIAGRSDVVLEVDGPSGNPTWRFAAHTGQPGWQGHRADSLALDIGGRPHALEVRSAHLLLGGGAVDLQGTVTETASAWPDTLTADGVTRWLATARSWRGESRAKDLPLEPMASLSERARPLGGRVSGRLAIGGAPAHPDLDLTLEGTPLRYGNVSIETLGLRAHYAERRLEVPELRLARGSLVTSASGEMPLVLGLGRRAEVPDAPMRWRIDAPNGDLSILPLLVPQIGSASGRFAIDATIGGTPRKPDLVGTMRVHDGILRLAGREEIVHGVEASLRLDEARVTLDTLSARQGDRGRVLASGTVDLEGFSARRYRFDLRMSDFTATEPGLYAVEFDGGFTVTDGPRVNGQWVPFVDGNVRVQRAVILFDFANQSETQLLATRGRPLYWTYSVQVTADNNLRWQPPDGDIEFSANLALEQTTQELRMYGEMRALRGYYHFLSNRFTIVKCDLTFDQVQGIDPVLDIEAVTRVTPVSGGPVDVSGTVVAGQDDPTQDITVRISGRAAEPNIEFASSPSSWDEARILQELTVGRFTSRTGAVALGDPLDHYLTRALNRTLSAEMSQLFRGYVNEWTLDRERGGLLYGSGEVIVGVGTQVNSRLQLRFRQRVPGLARSATTEARRNPFERDIEAEYRLNRFFYVTSELTQRRPLGGTVTTGSGPADFNVDLKARWEY